MAFHAHEQPEQAHRLDLIHVLRGVAALLVLFGHIAVGTNFRFPYGLTVFGGYQYLGVYMFFVISGFVVPWSLLSQRYTIGLFFKYMLRRLVRLDPPYFAMVAIGIAVAAYRSHEAGTAFPFSWSTIALHLGYLVDLAGHQWIVTVFWTLGIEFQFYVLIGLVFPLLSLVPGWLAGATVTSQTMRGAPSRGPTSRGLVFAILAVALGQIVLAFINQNAYFPRTWIYYSEYFTLGFLAFAVKTAGMHWAVLAGFCLTRAGLGGFTTEWGVVSAMSLLIVGVPHRLAWVWTTRLGACMNGLGNISYSLYLTHAVTVGWLTRRAMSRGWVATNAGAVLVYFGEFALCVFFATVFYVLFERPAVRLSHRIRFRPVSG